MVRGVAWSSEQRQALKEAVARFQQYGRTDGYRADLHERERRKKFFQQELPGHLEQLSEADIEEIVGLLWAHEWWANKTYVAQKIVETNGLDHLRRNLRLLYSPSHDPEEAYERVTSSVKHWGPSCITEMLAYIYPERCGVWNKQTRSALQKLGLDTLVKVDRERPTKWEYRDFNILLQAIADEMRQAGLSDVDLLVVDFFLYHVATGKDSVDTAGLPPLPTIPDLVDNRQHQMAQVLRLLLASSHRPTLDAITAFFNLEGLKVLEPEIRGIAHLRLLLGKEQQQDFVVGQRLLDELEHSTATGEVTAREIQRWRDFLALHLVEVRRYTGGFCHGKAYIVTGVPLFGAVGMVGSSNFTGAGLTKNLELNSVLKQGPGVEHLQELFDSLWEQSEDYKPELLELLQRFTRVYTPYEVYIKVIYEALRDKLDQDLGERDRQPSPIVLADFQHDGYLAAKEIIETYGGVLIADSVGLGKTFLALRLLDEYAYRERQTALIICPAAIADTVWRPLLQQHGIPHEIVSMEKVSQRDFPAEEYGHRFRIIVVDESHNFRNPETNRWPNLFRLVTAGDTDKKVVLLTATPVNNTVFDLLHQLKFITRGDPRALLAAGITHLDQYFREAERNHDALYEVMEALAVRRSRQFIRRNYPGAEIDGRRVQFPARELHTAHYSLKDTYGEDLYRRIASTIETLRLAPYQIEAYRRDVRRAQEKYTSQLSFFNETPEVSESAVQRLQQALGWSPEQAQAFLMTVGRQSAIAHIMRVLYLKRLESSVEALRVSLRRQRDFLSTFLSAVEAGKHLTAMDYKEWLRIEAQDEELAQTEKQDALEHFVDSLPALDPAVYDIDALISDTRKDIAELNRVLADLEQVQHDGKLEALKKLLTSPALMGKKVAVFSYFKDTARYIHRQLREDEQFLSALGHSQIAIVDSGVDPKERTDRITHFAPVANNRLDLPPDKQIQLLVSTDVLAEGQNLQDASIIVNYDLHWNPVRMIQRIGRIDRIGSPHSIIHVYNFFPEQELEDLLQLVQRLHNKLEAINRTVGLDASVLGEKPNPLDFNILRRVEQEDASALDEAEAQSEFAIGEFLKQDLLQFLRSLGEERLKKIPRGVGTGRYSPTGRRGFFAAFHNPTTRQHHWLFYDEDEGRIVERRLEAISRTGLETPLAVDSLLERGGGSMEFRELSEEQWQFIQPLLPPGARTGRPRADDRRTLNGILYVLTTGCRWMDMPKEYGSHKTAWRRLKEWQERGVWEGLWRRLLELGYQAGRLELGAVAVDATTVEARKGGRQ